jgi:predicted nuclease with TOPRIM domain
MADDVSIQSRIKSLIDEEHALRDSLGKGEISVDDEQTRLRSVEVELDQCWDLLRQRRAKREFGDNPDEAQVRSERTVEGYLG